MSQDSAGLQQSDASLLAQDEVLSAQDQEDMLADEDRASAERVQDLQGHGTTGLSPAPDDPDRNLVDPDIMSDRDRASGDSVV